MEFQGSPAVHRHFSYRSRLTSTHTTLDFVEASGLTVELRAVGEPSLASGVPHCAELLAFADAVVGTDPRQLTHALVQAAAIAANFSINDRAANATGIVLEGMFVRDSPAYRAALGIDCYRSACNTLMQTW